MTQGGDAALNEAHARALCADCGLCCDGALFGTVGLDAAGARAFRKRRLPVLDTGQGPHASLPCPALAGPLCTIYSHRPSICAEFVCRLASRVGRGRVAPSRARKLVDKARALRTRMRQPGKAGPSPRDLAALEAVLSDHFRNR